MPDHRACADSTTQPDVEFEPEGIARLDHHETLTALSRLGIFIKDLKRDVHLPNTFWIEWGYDADDMKGDRWLDALHPDDQERIAGSFDRQIAGQEEVSQSEYRIVRRDGRTRWVLSKSVIIARDDAGTPERLVGIDCDITEMKRAQLEVVRAREEAERRAREAEMLRRAGAAVAATLDREEAVSRVLSFLRSAVRFETATVQVLRDGVLEVIDCSGPVDQTCRAGVTFAPPEFPSYARAIGESAPVFDRHPAERTPDMPSGGTLSSEAPCGAMLGSGPSAVPAWIGVPLITRGKVLGLLTLSASQGSEFCDEQLRLATAIADYLALAVQNARLYEDTRYAASRDPLTGAFSRYWFVPFAARGIQQALREHSALSLIVIDLDHFKEVNDEFGHPAGDRVLFRIAETIADGLRSSDPLCRLGGEEFAVLVPGTDAATAGSISERMRERVAGLTHPEAGGRLVTISIGVAAIGETCSSYDRLLQRADQALYQSKRTGRNRVTLQCDGADEPDGPQSVPHLP